MAQISDIDILEHTNCCYYNVHYIGPQTCDPISESYNWLEFTNVSPVIKSISPVQQSSPQSWPTLIRHDQPSFLYQSPKKETPLDDMFCFNSDRLFSTG